jgi:hypothetical protein
VPINSLLLRIFAAGLPLVVIALIAGAIGWVTTGTQTEAVAPLAPADERPIALQGAVQSFSNDQLTIVMPDGATKSISVPGESAIEHMTAISREELEVGNWINGGAIPHAQTILALVGLVMISDPVILTP